MISYRTAIVLAYVLITPITASSVAAAKVQIFKCVSESGKLSFQKSPCPANDRAQRMLLAGDSQANRDAADELAAQTAADRAQQQQQARELTKAGNRESQTVVANVASKKAPVVCPLVAGDAVTINRPPQVYWDGATYRRFAPANRATQARLPSKTYLKNSGRWPDECPP